MNFEDMIKKVANRINEKRMVMHVRSDYAPRLPRVKKKDDTNTVPPQGPPTADDTQTQRPYTSS